MSDIMNCEIKKVFVTYTVYVALLVDVIYSLICHEALFHLQSG